MELSKGGLVWLLHQAQRRSCPQSHLCSLGHSYLPQVSAGNFWNYLLQLQQTRLCAIRNLQNSGPVLPSDWSLPLLSGRSMMFAFERMENAAHTCSSLLFAAPPTGLTIQWIFGIPLVCIQCRSHVLSRV